MSLDIFRSIGHYRVKAPAWKPYSASVRLYGTVVTFLTICDIMYRKIISLVTHYSESRSKQSGEQLVKGCNVFSFFFPPNVNTFSWRAGLLLIHLCVNRRQVGYEILYFQRQHFFLFDTKNVRATCSLQNCRLF